MYPLYFLFKYIKSWVFPYNEYFHELDHDYVKRYARGETDGVCYVWSRTCLVFLYVGAWMLLAVSIGVFSVQDLVIYTNVRNETNATLTPDNRTINCTTDFDYIYNNWFLAFGVAGMLYFFVVVIASLVTLCCSFSPLMSAVSMFYDNVENDLYIDYELRYTTAVYAVLDAFAFAWVAYGYSMFLGGSDMQYCRSGAWAVFSLQVQYLFWLYIAIASYALFLNFINYNAGLDNYKHIQRMRSVVTVNTDNSGVYREESMIMNEDALGDFNEDLEVFPEYLGNPNRGDERDLMARELKEMRERQIQRKLEDDRRMQRKNRIVPTQRDLAQV